MSSEPSLSRWKSSHARERVDLAHYEIDKDPCEVDLARENQWCATSVTDVAPGVTRPAAFYLPEVTRSELPRLPSKQDASLINSCRLGEMWYETRGPNLVSGLVKELTASWGQPAELPKRIPAKRLHARLGFLERCHGLAARRGQHLDCVDRLGQRQGIDSRTIMWMVRERLRDLDPWAVGFDVTIGACKYAGPDVPS